MSVAPDDVRRQLDRLLASSQFAGADRLSRFLRFVVERSLAGEADRLKEYVVGVEVFDRDDKYDPRIDSIVRVEAGRLRSKLEEYYGGPGRDGEVRIRIPRGGYAAVFEVPAAEAAPESPTASAPTSPAGFVEASARRPTWFVNRRPVTWRAASLVVGALLAVGVVLGATLDLTSVRSSSLPSIAVLPIEHYSDAPSDRLLADQLTDGVMGELTRLQELSVVSRTSTRQFAAAKRPLPETAKALNADVVMESSLAVDGDTVRVDVRLVNAVQDRKKWGRTFTGTTADLADLQRRIAEAVSAAATLAPVRWP